MLSQKAVFNRNLIGKSPVSRLFFLSLWPP
jgi:hypothetical protein